MTKNEIAEINLINRFFYHHEVCVRVYAKHPKTGQSTALKTPGYIRYKLIAYAAGVEFNQVFRLKTELDSLLANYRKDEKVQVRFDSKEFALEVPRIDPVALNYAPAQLPPMTAMLGRSYAFGQANDNMLTLTDSNSAHTLIAGATGSGKSEMLRTVVASLLDNNSPTDLQMLVIDLKNEGLAPFANCPHVLAYAEEPVQASAIIKWVHAELEKRNREKYSTPRIVLAIDELAVLASGCGKDAVHNELAQIGLMGRSRGINIIAAAQNPSSALIGPQLKTQLTTRVIGLLDNSSTAWFITGRKRSGADALPGKGAMLLIRDGGAPLRIQGYFVGDRIDEIAASITAKHEHLRAHPISMPPVDEVAKLARKAAPIVESFTRDGKLQRGAIGAVVAQLFGPDARNDGHNNRMANKVIEYLGSKGMQHAS